MGKFLSYKECLRGGPGVSLFAWKMLFFFFKLLYIGRQAGLISLYQCGGNKRSLNLGEMTKVLKIHGAGV